MTKILHPELFSVIRRHKQFHGGEEHKPFCARITGDGRWTLTLNENLAFYFFLQLFVLKLSHMLYSVSLLLWKMVGKKINNCNVKLFFYFFLHLFFLKLSQPASKHIETQVK